MAFTKPTINKIEVDIKNLTVYIRTIKKFGKTTLFRDTVLEKYGDPERGMLIKIGAENGDGLLDALNSTSAETWKDFVDMKKWLITEKGKEHNIEMLCFDVADELFPIIDNEVVRLSNTDSTYKKCKTVNGAMGGYTEGTKKVVELAKEYFLDLKKAGFGIWVLAHTKYKAIKEKGDIEDGYMNLTSPLNSAYEGVFGDIFDCVLTGMIDREISSQVISVDDKGKEKIKKSATAEIRKLYLRGTTSIDAGCRFTDGSVPEFIVFDEPDMAKKFIKVMEEGMEKSKSKYKTGSITLKPKEEIKQETIKEEIIEDNLELDDIVQEEEIIKTEEIVQEDELIVDVEKNTKLKKEFVPKYKLATEVQKQLVKDILAKYDTKKLDDKKPTKMFEELLAIFE
jgi:hypothetical protein